MNEFRTEVAQLFGSFAGQSAVLTIPRPYLALCNNDHRAALLLSQCVYWTDRTNDAEGWFAKSYVDWNDELGLSEYEVRRAAKVLASVGLETKLKKFNGAPTLHYRMDKDKFSVSILEFLQNGNLRNSRNDPEETQGSLTEITSETTTEIDSAPDGAQSPDEVASPTKRKHPNEPLHDALLEQFGLSPDTMTKAADRGYWTAAAELKKVGISAEQVPALYKYVRRLADAGKWAKWSVMALAKYAPEFLKDDTHADDASTYLNGEVPDYWQPGYMPPNEPIGFTDENGRRCVLVEATSAPLADYWGPPRASDLRDGTGG